MKVKPGQLDQYMDCEAAWAKIHQARQKAGHITGWQLERILFPSGTGAEYDFITITMVDSWANIHQSWSEDTWDELTAGMSEEEIEIADAAESYRDLVKREIWDPVDMALDKSGKTPRFSVENFMKIPATGWEAWIGMESEFFKPVHEKSIELGNRAGWFLGLVVLPRGENMEYQASTVDFYHNWEDMTKDNDPAWEAVYPTGINYEMVEQRINALRTIVRTEVRELVFELE
jgi:hypothetical protein